MVRTSIYIALLLPVALFGQITASFQIENELSLCKNSAIHVENTSSIVEDYYWDFCPESLTETSNVSVRALPNFSAGYGYELVEDDGQWYGFLLGRSANKLYRLDFGETPYSSPALVDLGNPGGLFSGPEGLELYQENGNWFAFTGKGDNGSGQVVRLSFGSSLLNTPTATGLGSFGFDGTRIRELRVVNQGSDVILLVIGYGFNAINRINFGSSVLNSPASQSSLTIPGAAFPVSFSIVHHESPWRLHVLSDNGQIQQLNFGNNIMGSVSVEGTFTFGAIGFPLRIQSVYTNGSYFSVVSDAAFKYAIINFNDLSLSQAPTVVANNNTVRYISFDIVKFRGALVVQGSYNDLFSTAVYQAACSSTPGYSYLKDPDVFKFSTATSQNIDLNLSNQSVKQSKSVGILIQDKLAPTIDFSHDQICAQSSIDFSYSSSEPLASLNWSFGDSNTSTQSNPSNLYNQAGQYQVSLHVIDANTCSNSIEKEVQLYDQVIPTFDLPSVSPFCTNQEYTFQNTSTNDDNYPVSWNWAVNGTNLSASKNLTYLTTQGGGLNIELTATVTGCSNSVTESIADIIVGPAVDFDVTGNCLDQPFQFVNRTVGDGTITYTWKYDAIESQLTDIEYQFSTPGQYNVELVGLSSNGCNNTIEKLVSVRSTPQPDFYVDLPPFSCTGTPTQFHDMTPALIDGNVVSWQWNFNDGSGSTSSHQNPQHTYSTAGIYNVSLHVESNFGCESTVQIPIEIAESPKANFTFGPACLNKGTQFLGTSDEVVSAWKWTINNTFYGFPEPTHTFNFSGNYPVTLTVVGINGCEGSLTKTVEIRPAPLLDFNTSIACSGQETIFTDQTTGVDLPQTWQWNFESNAIGEYSPASYTFQAAGAKPVKMSIVTQSGCEYWLTKNVVVAPSPTAAFTTSETFGAPPLAIQFSNTSLNASSYSWNFGANSAGSTESNPTFTYTQLGEYLIELTATNGAGCSDVATQSIQVLVPRYNLSLDNLEIQEGLSSGAKVPVVTITNNSNVPVAETNVWITGSSGLRVKSNVNLNLAPGAMQELTLPLEVFSTEKFICVELNPTADADLTDNQRCENLLEQPVLVAPYPNPTLSVFWLDVVLVEAADGSLKIVDNMGKIVFEQEFESLHQGMNRIEIDFSGQPPGMYVALWSVGGRQTEFRFIRQ